MPRELDDMYVTRLDQAREYDLKRRGAKGVRVKYLLHAGVGAKRIQLRVFTIAPGGHTSMERHVREHEVFVLKGKALFKVGESAVQASPGCAIFIASNEPHQIINLGAEPIQFLCTKETAETPSEISNKERRSA